MTTSSSQIIQPLASKTLATVSNLTRVQSLVRGHPDSALQDPAHGGNTRNPNSPPFNSVALQVGAAAPGVGSGRRAAQPERRACIQRLASMTLMTFLCRLFPGC